MSKILFVQPVFCPDQKRLERNINSIYSFLDYVRDFGTDNHDLTILIGGWAKTDELWNAFVDAVKQKFGGQINPLRFDHNYGKAVIVNKLVSVSTERFPDWQYLFTADSDILFLPTEKNLFARLVRMAEESSKIKNKPFGMTSLNQQGANCHWEVVKENGHVYDYEINGVMHKELFNWPNNPSGIAGGCLFVGRDFWNKVGGYKVFGVYSGDDAVLLLECGQQGFAYQMSSSISIVHPLDDDAEYIKWKSIVCPRDFRTGIKRDISAHVQEAENFWNNKK